MITKTFELKNNRTREEIDNFKTTLKVTMSETHLTFDFYCKNSKHFSAGVNFNDPVYNGDVCEAFICADEDLYWYYEIEVAPNNCQFLMKMNYKEKVVDGKVTSDIAMNPISLEDNFLSSNVEIIGNDYKLSFSLPLDKIGYKPEVGIRFNAFRIETEGGETDKNLIALNPTMCSTFHVPTCFIKLI